MNKLMDKYQIGILLVVAIIVAWQAPAHAQLWRINEELTIRFANDTLTIDRNLNRREQQRPNDILRDRDLLRAVKDFIDRIKHSASVLKARQTDQIRGIELNRITASNTKDMIQRNKAAQQSQKRLQKDRLRELRARNRDLTQRTRDLSRK